MTDMMKYELRSGWLGMAKKFQPLDLLGAALGSYFIFQGVTNRAPNWLTIALGSLMVYIHTQRFFLAPSDKAGLIQLLKGLDITPEELESIKKDLASS